MGSDSVRVNFWVVGKHLLAQWSNLTVLTNSTTSLEEADLEITGIRGNAARLFG